MSGTLTETSPLLVGGPHGSQAAAEPQTSTPQQSSSVNSPIVLNPNEEPSNEEPITTRAEPRRIHWLDNLRTVLTVLLIFHHAVLETVHARHPTDYSKAEILPLAIFATLNKSGLWTLFFFTSGYSASLALGSIHHSESDAAFYRSRTFKVGVPALVYEVLIRPVLFVILVFGGFGEVFGRYDEQLTYARVAGPAAYVAVLIVFDYTYLLVRWARRRRPDSFLWRIETFSASHPYIVGTSGFLIFSVATFLGCLWPYYPLYPILLLLPYDIPGPGAPLSFLVAYTAGVQFKSAAVQSYIVFLGLAQTYIAFVVSFITAVLFMGLAQHLSPPLWEFIGLGSLNPFFREGGFNAHTAFFTLWAAFVFFIVQPYFISIFARARWANHDLGFATRHTYPMMYLNMIPILIAVYYLRGSYRLASEALIAGLVGVSSSSFLVVAPAKVEYL